MVNLTSKRSYPVLAKSILALVLRADAGSCGFATTCIEQSFHPSSPQYETQLTISESKSEQVFRELNLDSNLGTEWGASYILSCSE